MIGTTTSPPPSHSVNIQIMSIYIKLLSFILLLAPLPAAATSGTNPPSFLIPLACTLNTDCWVVNHVDTDPAPETAADYRCGTQTTDAHQGTDFALRDMTALRSGVAVLAAAAGTVLRVRDNSDDLPATGEDIEKMRAENRGCGNGILIDHGNQWQTIYCHLKKGSPLVKQGDKVTAGQHIAAVGHSGAAEFPHLHFGVFHQSRVIDPFTGNGEDKDCRAPQKSMFLPGLPAGYQPVTLFAAGFADAPPAAETLYDDARNPDTLAVTIPALTFWGMIYNVRAGDEIALQIRDPQNRILAERTLTQDEPAARQFYYVGKRNNGVLQTGAYTGTFTVTRTRPDGPKITRQTARAIYIQ